MNKENRIPFDWDKYQSGEYEAICRNGVKPDCLAYNSNAKEPDKIAMWIQGELYSRCEDGTTWGNRELDHDLFLIPKTKKFQAWINLYSNGQAELFSTKAVADELNKYTEIGISRVECRVIEWTENGDEDEI